MAKYIGVPDNSNVNTNSTLNVKIVDTNEISIINTTIASAISAGQQTVIPTSMTSIGIGTPLLIDTLASGKQETITVSAVTGTTFTATFRFAHSAGVSVVLGVERQNMSVADPTTYNSIASVATGVASVSDIGLTVRAIPTPLATGANTIGSVNLNASTNTIGGVTQSGTWTVGLLAGNNIAGKFGIDQTTPGTTNGVQITGSLPAGSNALGSVNVTGTTTIAGTVSLGSGSQSVGNVGINSGTNLIGKVGFDQTTPGTTNGVQLSGGPGTSLANPFFNQTLGVYNLTPPTITNGSANNIQLDVNGNLKVIQGGSLATGTNSIGNVGLNTGSNTVGKFGIDQSSPGTSNGVQINFALPTGSNTIGAINQAGVWNIGLNAGNNIVGAFKIDQTTPGTTNGIQVVAPLPTGTNSIGLVGLNPGVNSLGTVGLNTGSNLVGKFGIDQTTPGTTNAVQLSGPGTSVANLLYTEDIGVYNSSAPVLTNGQTSAIQLDSAGNQKVVQAGSLPTGSNSLGTIGINTGSNTIGKVGIDQTTPGTSNAVQLVGTLPTGTNTIGAVGLNAGTNVIGAVTQSGTFTVGLNTPVPAGTNIIGKTGIDQTTPGTTNGIQVTGPGTSSGNTLFATPIGTYNSSPLVLTNGQIASAQLDASGNQKVNLITSIPTGTNTIGAVNINGTVPINGSVSIGAALPTGTNSLGSVGLNAGANIVGKFGIDQSTPGTTNAVQLIVALPTGANTIGSVNQAGIWNTGLSSGVNLVGKVGFDQTTPGTSNGVQITGPGTTSTNALYGQSLGVYNTTAPTLTNTQASAVQLDVSGNLKTVQINSIPAGTNTIGAVGLNAGNASIGNVGLNAGTSLIGKFGIDQSVPGTSNGVQLLNSIPTGANTIGAINLNPGTNSLGTVGLNTSTNIIGKVTVDQTVPGTTNAIQITGPGTSLGNALYNQAIGVYSLTPPTLTNGQANSLQLDSTGNLKVIQSGSLASGSNSIGTVGLNSGTNSVGTVGLNVGTNVVGKFGIDQSTPGTSNGVQLLTATPTGTNSIGTVGLNTGVNSIGTIGLNAGTNIVGSFRIDQTTPGNTNGVQISGAGTTTANTLFTTSVGTYNSTPPTLTNGQVGVSQLDINGNQKVNLVVALPTGTNTIGNIGLNAGSNAIGTVGINTALPIGSNTIGNVTLNDVRTTGTLAAATLNNAFATTLSGQAVVGISIASNTNNATVSFEATIDGITWFAINAVVSGTGLQVGSASATSFNGRVNSAGYNQIRTRVSTISVAATITVTYEASVGSSMTTLAEPLPGGTNTIGNVNINGTIPISGTVSVGSALPSGTNTIGAVNLNAGTNSLGTVGINTGANTIGKVGIDQSTPGTSNGVQIIVALPTGTNTIGAVNQAGIWNVGLTAGTNLVGKFGIDQSTPGTSNGVQLLTAIPTGTNSVGTVGLNAGSNVVGKFSIDQTTPGTTNGVQLLTGIPGGTNTIGNVNLNSGTNSLGTVGLNAGNSIIGKVTVDQSVPGTSNAVQVSGPGTSVANSLFSQAIAVYNTATPALTNGQANPLQVDSTGRLQVVQAGGTSAGTNSIGTVGLNTGNNTIGTVNLGTQYDFTNGGVITTADILVAAPNGTGGLVNGTSTTSSYVAILCPGGTSAWDVQITNLNAGSTLYFEASLDSTTGQDGNWAAVNGRQTGVLNTNLTYNPSVNGIYRGNSSAIKYFRVRSVGTLTGTPSILIRLSTGTGAVFLNAGLPPSQDTIGNITQNDLRSVGSVSAGTLNSSFTLSLAGQATVGLAITGNTNNANIAFEGTIDGTNWLSVPAVVLPSNASVISTTLASFNGILSVAGFYQIRTRVATVSAANTVVVTFEGTVAAISPIVADVNLTRTITTTDIVVAAPNGVGGLVTGASTAGSYVVALDIGGNASWAATITGLTSGSLYFETSTDTTTGADGNWIAVNARQSGTNVTVIAIMAIANGVYRGNVAGFKALRIRSVGTLTGTPVITLDVSASPGVVYLNSDIPAGSNIIGKVGIDQTTQGVTNFVASNVTQLGGVTLTAQAKGIQATNFIPVQKASDTGRQIFSMVYDTGGTTQSGSMTEALFSMNTFVNGTVVTGVTSYTVPAGKTLRLSKITFDFSNGQNTAIQSLLRLRANIGGGTLTVNSPQIAVLSVSAQNLNNVADHTSIEFSEGMEFPAGAVIGVGHLETGNSNLRLSTSVLGYLY